MDLLSKIEKIAKEKLFSKYPQKYYHSLRVVAIAKKLAKAEGYSETDTLEMAALLHDISQGQSSNSNNARESLVLAKKILINLVSQDQMLIIEKAILATDKKKLTNYSIEESILHDANILDALGVTGLLRVAFNMGRENDHDSIKDLPQWFKEYSINLQKLIIGQHAKELAAIQFSEIKKLG